MNVQASDLVVGLLMVVFGILGLILASHAVDVEMYVFGLSLTGFAGLFVFGQVRRHFDTVAAAQGAGHD